MPTVLIRGEVTASGVPFELKGFTSGPVVEVFVEESILGRETEVPISGLGEETEPPPPVISAHILGAPVQATELTTITTLSAELRDEEGEVIELYDPANWTWSVVSGGGSFAGDDLTLPSAPATVMIRAIHNVEQLPDTASILVQAVATFTPEFFNLPASVIAGQQTNPLRSRVLNSDGSTAEQIDTNWTYSIVSGVGVISGPVGNQVLVPNAGGAGQSITVRATYTGGLNVSPNFDQHTTDVIAQPTFPDTIEPAGHTVIANFDGSTLVWPGWTANAAWSNNTVRTRVISDSLSKHGQVIEKRYYEGDQPGWYGRITRNIGLWRELYVRMVFRFESNWAWHPAGGKYIYAHNSGSGADQRNFILGPGNPTVANNTFGIGFKPGYPVSVFDFSSGSGQWVANLPPIEAGSYQTLEYLIGADMGVDDGYLRMALNGQEATNWVLVGSGVTKDLRTAGHNWQYNNNVPDKRLGALIEAFLFWGGSGANFDRDTNIRLSEFFISGKN